MICLIIKDVKFQSVVQQSGGWLGIQQWKACSGVGGTLVHQDPGIQEDEA